MHGIIVAVGIYAYCPIFQDFHCAYTAHMDPADADLWRRAVADVEPLSAPRVRPRACAAEPPLARLDLHGMTLDQAHAALTRLLAHTSAKRALIITGRSGDLAREVPLWLETPDLAGRVRTVESAGLGAILLRLRDTKKS
ncbi:MAG TPA: hypothetical protein DDX54_00285 [Rhodospirillaceae bacterium]|jgi:DNA-nicking Smr family endonuclease|nr:Smr/MutS family protein [Alphaproteobacteria bacterium]HBH25832.1 hypothetical protein [Rhodospirillaceae bacterium]